MDNLRDVEIEGAVEDKQLARIFDAPYLCSLALHDKRVTDNRLAGLGKCGLLRSLDLSRTSVNGSFAVKLPPDVPWLDLLDLSQTRVDDDHLRELTSNVQVGHLRLYGTRISDRGLRALRPLELLDDLDLGETKVTAAGLDDIAALPSLRKLYLPVSIEADDIARRLVGMKDLEVLSGGNEKFSNDGLRNIAKFESLEYLDIAGNRFTADGLRELQRLHHLRRLTFWHCGITDDGIAAISAIPSVRGLAFYDCQKITDAGMRYVGEMTGLRSLCIDGAPGVGDAGVLQLRGLKWLQSLELRVNLTDRALDALVGMAQLRSLYLDSVRITAGGMEKLSVLSRLESLNVPTPKLTPETVPKLFKSLKYWDRSTL